MGFRDKMFNTFAIWLTGGVVYYFSEILFRGYSHFSMLICGGFCFLLVGIAGNIILKAKENILISVFKIMIIGSMIITTLEYITGMIVNVKYNLKVWDYSDMKYNVDGQICLLYSCFWALISLICVYVYNILRECLFKKNQT